MPVYFIAPVDGGPVKIGQSRDVDARRQRLEGHYGRELVVLATMPGGRAEEAEIHGRFARLRLGRTEQFRPAPELMEFINRPLLVGPNPDAVEVMVPTREHVEVRVGLTPEIHKELRIEAARRGMSMALLVRKMVEEFLKRTEAEEIARQAAPPRRKPGRPPKDKGGAK